MIGKWKPDKEKLIALGTQIFEERITGDSFAFVLIEPSWPLAINLPFRKEWAVVMKKKENKYIIKTEEKVVFLRCLEIRFRKPVRAPQTI